MIEHKCVRNIVFNNLHQQKGTREGCTQTIWWLDGDIVKIISFDPTNNELKSSMVQRSTVPNTEHTLKYYYKHIQTKVRHFVHLSHWECHWKCSRDRFYSYLMRCKQRKHLTKKLLVNELRFEIDGTLNIRPKIWSMIIVLPETILIEWNKWWKEERRQQQQCKHRFSWIYWVQNEAHSISI